MTAPSNMRSLDRSFDLLNVLQTAHQPLRLAEISRASALHIATAQRIVNVLVARGYAARSGDGYTAGPEFRTGNVKMNYRSLANRSAAASSVASSLQKQNRTIWSPSLLV